MNVTGLSRPKADDGDTADNIAESENEIEPLIIHRGPYFDKSATKNVTTLVGKTAYLNCKVRNVGNRTVSNRISLLIDFTSKTVFRLTLVNICSYLLVIY